MLVAIQVYNRYGTLEVKLIGVFNSTDAIYSYLTSDAVRDKVRHSESMRVSLDGTPYFPSLDGDVYAYEIGSGPQPPEKWKEVISFDYDWEN